MSEFNKYMADKNTLTNKDFIGNAGRDSGKTNVLQNGTAERCEKSYC